MEVEYSTPDTTTKSYKIVAFLFMIGLISSFALGLNAKRSSKKMKTTELGSLVMNPIPPTNQYLSQFTPDFEQCLQNDDKDVLDCCVNTDNPVLNGVEVISTSMLPDQGTVYGLEDFSYVLDTSYGPFTFYFATATSRNIFASDPWFFAPAFGGFDAAQFCDSIRVSTEKAFDATGPFWDIPEGGGNLWWYQSSKDATSLGSRVDTASCVSLWKKAFGEEDGFFNTDCFLSSKKQSLAHKDMKNHPLSAAVSALAPASSPVSPSEPYMGGTTETKNKAAHYVHGVEEWVYNTIIDTIKTHGDLATNLGREPTFEEFQLYKRQKMTASDMSPDEIHHVKDLSDAVYKAAFISITTGENLESMIGRAPTEIESQAIARIRNNIMEGTWRYDENGHLIGSETALLTYNRYH